MGKLSQIAKTLESTSIRYQSDAKVSDQYLIDIDPGVFGIWDGVSLVKDLEKNYSVTTVLYGSKI